MLRSNGAMIGNIVDNVISSMDKKTQASEYLVNPVAWAKDYLGIQMWSKQAEVAMSIVHNKNVVVKAGHEVGKSWLAGVLICWWIDVHWKLPGGVFVVSTAPSTSQINAIVWREVRRFHALAAERFKGGLVDHPLPGYITADAHWRLDGGIELAYGRKPPEGKEDTMSGIHARYVLAIGDEAVGLAEALIDDLGNITSNATSRRFLILNPTNPLSYVAKIFKNNVKAWHTHSISVFDSPNFHGGEGLPIEVLETLVDQSYVDDKISEWGQAYWDDDSKRMLSRSPKFISRVLGDFAWDMGLTLIPIEDMAVGLDLNISPSLETRCVLGVDVSRSLDGDMNTIYMNHDGKLRLYDAWNERNAMRTADRIHESALACGARQVRIDGSGLGGPIADRVAELSIGHDYEVYEMIGGATSPDTMRWYNSRAYWYATFGEMLRDGQIDIDPKDEQLQEELLGIEFKFPAQGVQKLLIESKDDMRKRGVGSPDYADGAIYAMANIDYLNSGPQPGDIVGYDEDADLVEQHGYYSGVGSFGW